MTACHYCTASQADENGGPVGLLVDLRPDGPWARPVCAVHVTRLSTTGHAQVLLDGPDVASLRIDRPCSSWRVLAVIEGSVAESRWCPRQGGPCPFPNTLPIDSLDPGCAVEAVQSARDDLVAQREAAR